jgi:hypothetical protein
MTLLVRTALVLWLVTLSVGLVVVWRSRGQDSVVEAAPRESCAVFFFNYYIRRSSAD